MLPTASSTACSPENHSLACPATLCRFENRSENVSLLRVMEILIDTFIDSFGRSGSIEPLILDIDATADPAHGDQERNFFNSFYDCHCFLLLLVFCGDRLLFSWLRPSARGAAYNAGTVTELQPLTICHEIRPTSYPLHRSPCSAQQSNLPKSLSTRDETTFLNPAETADYEILGKDLRHTGRGWSVQNGPR